MQESIEDDVVDLNYVCIYYIKYIKLFIYNI